MNTSQSYISEKVRNSNNDIINPATNEELILRTPLTNGGALAVGNAMTKFRDGFALGFDTTTWDEAWTNQGTGFRVTGGNNSGASYLNISMCPFTMEHEYELTFFCGYSR